MPLSVLTCSRAGSHALWRVNHGHTHLHSCRSRSARAGSPDAKPGRRRTLRMPVVGCGDRPPVPGGKRWQTHAICTARLASTHHINEAHSSNVRHSRTSAGSFTIAHRRAALDLSRASSHWDLQAGTAATASCRTWLNPRPRRGGQERVSDCLCSPSPGCAYLPGCLTCRARKVSLLRCRIGPSLPFVTVQPKLTVRSNVTSGPDSARIASGSCWNAGGRRSRLYSRA